MGSYHFGHTLLFSNQAECIQWPLMVYKSQSKKTKKQARSNCWQRKGLLAVPAVIFGCHPTPSTGFPFNSPIQVLKRISTTNGWNRSLRSQQPGGYLTKLLTARWGFMMASMRAKTMTLIGLLASASSFSLGNTLLLVFISNTLHAAVQEG